jgi:hypothetical protein
LPGQQPRILAPSHALPDPTLARVPVHDAPLSSQKTMQGIYPSRPDCLIN